jgi:hypothetical protein
LGASANGDGHKVFNAPSPAYGAEIVYRVGPGAVSTASSGTGGGDNDGNNSQPNAGGSARGQGQRGQRGPQASFLGSSA